MECLPRCGQRTDLLTRSRVDKRTARIGEFYLLNTHCRMHKMRS